jgi:hypothetical protein
MKSSSSLVVLVLVLSLTSAAPAPEEGRFRRQLTWEQLRSGNWGAIWSDDNGGGLLQKILLPVDTVLALLPDEAKEILDAASDAVTNVPIIGGIPLLKGAAVRLIQKLDALLVKHGKLPLQLQAGTTTTTTPKPSFWETWSE